MQRQGTVIASLVIALFLAVPAIATASETIGQTGSDISCATDESYVQRTLAAQTPYSPSAYGVITSWTAAAGADPNQTVKLMVLRPAAGTQFTAVQKDVVRTLTSPDALNTFTGLRLPIEPSERLGIYLPSGSNYPCEFSTAIVADEVGWTPGSGEPPAGVATDYSGTDTEVRVNAQAVVERDADRDVFGDETQDKCVGTAGTANGCPSTVSIDKLKQKGEKKVKVTVTVPGSGTLQVRSAGKTTKPITENLTATAKQHLKLVLKLTGSAIGRMRQAGRLKLKVKATYTPPGGQPGSDGAKTNLKS